MPLARYFLFVGAALLALLFIVDAYLPKSPATASADARVDKATIRIHSDRKWPERVVFDTNQPTIAPVAVALTGVPAAVAEVSANARARDAFAQVRPSAPDPAQVFDLKKLESKQPPQRRIVKRRAAPRVMLVAQQPQFGLFGNNTW